MSTFIARYRGECAEEAGGCGEPIYKGQEVLYTGSHELVHAECTPGSDRPVGSICPVCRIEKPCFCD